MGEIFQIKARNKKEARNKAVKKLEGEVDGDQLRIELIEEKKGFLGLGKKQNTYRVEVEENGGKKKEEEALDLVEDIELDGEFKFKINDEGIFIRVSPPEGKGQPVDFLEVRKELEAREIKDYDKRNVQQIVKEAEDEFKKIAERKPELDRDFELKIEVSKDKMKAFLTYNPALGGKEITEALLKEALEEEGIVYGLKEDKIEDILANRERVEEILIAEGKEPVSGEDGKLIYHFEDDKKKVGTKREDGSIDFYDLGLINNVEPGDVLVTLREPEPGIPGKNVYGEEVKPPKPKEVSLPKGKNVEIEEEIKLIAAAEGQVVKDGKKVNVLPIYEVSGDVDLNTGNIDFVGNVNVKGNVHEGFKVKAEGNVEIRGNVEAANIEATGEVVIHKGFVGKGKGKIDARGDVRVKFVENGNINTRGDIVVSEAVMHSELRAGGKIEVSEKKGHLVGGVFQATHGIEANIVGSSLATETRLEVGINPEIKSRIQELEEKVQTDQNNLLKTKKALKILNKIKKEHGKLPPDKEKTYYKLVSTRKKIEKMLDNHNNDLEELQEKISDAHKGRIKIKEKVFPGVKLVIGKSQFNVRDQLGAATFMEEEGEVRQFPL